MKVVFASTPDQEEKIKELIRTFYQNVFPLYYSDKEIEKFEALKVLHTSTRHFEYFGTLKEAYQVITSLQTLISILESTTLLVKHKSMFQRNVAILKEYGLFFPFDFEQFLEADQAKENHNDSFSIYTKAANELLI
ncbi:YhcU family protein [Robertmurraya sp. DFI.2.37]|uniref:YhcU family protein n=1 Tax=Robertmurraya sp. DFI.2.37 TaxID=3031819 RepID=UPI0023DA5E2B|nr:YhcU family protein [Robertmurraya sp. DFI.2.37]MDF1510211.1 YhcU family protein [Robertmurraya sp. DFI.2.37]